MDSLLEPRGASRSLCEEYARLRRRCDHQPKPETSGTPGGKTGVKKAAELTLEYKRKLENGVTQFARLKSQLAAEESKRKASRRLDFGDGGSDEMAQVMRETLSQIEENFKRDLSAMKTLVPRVKSVEATTPLRRHLKHNIQDMCAVICNHYAAAWKDALAPPEERPPRSTGTTTGGRDRPAEDESTKSVSEALMRLYFHLERCEQCVDGSEVYVAKLPGLVVASRRLRSHVRRCLDVALKSRTGDGGGLGGEDCVVWSAGEGIRIRRGRSGSFKDEQILDHLYRQNFFTFVSDLKNRLMSDYRCVRSFTGNENYRLLFDHDAMEVVHNTLDETVPPFLDVITAMQQKISGKRRTIVTQVATHVAAALASPTKSINE